MWRQAKLPDLRTFLAGEGKITSEQLSQILCVDQRERWLRGERPETEYYSEFFPLRRSPALSTRSISFITSFWCGERSAKRPQSMNIAIASPSLSEQLQVQLSLRDALETAISAGRKHRPEGNRQLIESDSVDASVRIRDFGRTWPRRYGRSVQSPPNQPAAPGRDQSDCR